MRIVFLLTLAFFLNACAVTPRLLLGQTNGISLTFTPQAGVVKPTGDPTTPPQYVNPNPPTYPGSSAREQWDPEQSEEEMEERRDRRRRVLQGVLYASLAVAAVGGLGYLLATADSDDSEECPAGECYVNGYTRSNGTYVEGYCRSC